MEKITSCVLSKIGEDAHKNAIEKGFRPCDDHIALLMCQDELFEALGEVRKGRKIDDIYYTDKGWFLFEKNQPKDLEFIEMYSEIDVEVDQGHFENKYYNKESGRYERLHRWTHWRPFDLPNGNLKPEGVAVELVDFIIRSLERLHSEDWSFCFSNVNYDVISNDIPTLISHLLTGYNQHVSINVVINYLLKNNIDVISLIKEKMNYNSKRPFKHGKEF